MMAWEFCVTRERILGIILLIATGLLVGACLFVLSPFLPALTWAFSLAIIAQPLFAWIRKRLKHPQLAAGLAVAAISVCLVGPVVLLGVQIAGEIAGGVDALRSLIAAGGWQEILHQHPWLRSAIEWVSRHYNFQDAATQFAQAARSWAAGLLKGGFATFLQLGVALYSLFFFFRDRDRVLGAARRFLPLSEAEASRVFDRVQSMVRATIYGNVATSLIQGTLGGLMFWVLGLPVPLIWGAAMFLFSLVPGVGSVLVWGPTVAVLALTGQWWRAGILCVWGALVVGSIDNLLYPFLVGRDIRMHTLAVFLSLLGGLFVFGAAGLVLGPVLFAVTLALIDILRRRTAFGGSSEAGSG